MRVLLFDIDGTLVQTAGAGRRALERAFAHVLGWRDPLAGVELAGHTDRGIVRDAMRLRGASTDEIAAALAPVLESYLGFLDEELGRGPPGRVLPGVGALLDALDGLAVPEAPDVREALEARDVPEARAARGGVAVGLLTGNTRGGAERKLRAFDLWRRFRFGAFGCDAEPREALLPVALARAAALALRPAEQRGALDGPSSRAGGGSQGGWAAGSPASARSAVIIGDTPRDVAVARAHGARCLAVATGRYDVAALERAGADLAVPDLADTERALAFLLASEGDAGAAGAVGGAGQGDVERGPGERPALDRHRRA